MFNYDKIKSNNYEPENNQNSLLDHNRTFSFIYFARNIFS